MRGREAKRGDLKIMERTHEACARERRRGVRMGCVGRARVGKGVGWRTRVRRKGRAFVIGGVGNYKARFHH